MALPPALQSYVDDFGLLQPDERLELLVELGDELPALPDFLAQRPELLERVVECQSPVSVSVSVTEVVAVHASVAREAAATRGFAAILVLALTGTSPEEALAVPPSLPTMLGLTPAVSRLRLQGMSAMLQRVQRQIEARR